jgi:hypothetical protein
LTILVLQEGQQQPADHNPQEDQLQPEPMGWDSLVDLDMAAAALMAECRARCTDPAAQAAMAVTEAGTAVAAVAPSPALTITRPVAVPDTMVEAVVAVTAAQAVAVHLTLAVSQLQQPSCSVKAAM